MTDDQLAAIRQRCAEATPGPWEWRKRSQWAGDHVLTNFTGPAPDDYSDPMPFVHTDGSACGEYGPDIDVNGPDAAFIAAARSDVAALLAEVERLRAELAHHHCESCDGSAPECWNDVRGLPPPT